MTKQCYNEGVTAWFIIELSNKLVDPKQHRCLTLKRYKVTSGMAKLTGHIFGT
jgi:hypothetical protein